MGAAKGFQNRFNAGELAPEAWSDSDLQAHAHGMALGLNFIGTVPGALARRAGFYDAGACISQAAPSRLIAFERAAGQVLVLEFGDEAVAVWQADGTPLMDGSDQVSFASPYATEDLAGLMWKQDGDMIVFAHAAGLRTKALIRTSDTAWAFSDFEFRNGPWRSRNATATTITVSGGTLQPGQSVSLDASAAVFDAGHVGALFRFQQNDGSPDALSGGKTMPSWTSDTDFDETLFDSCLSAGRAYKVDTAGASAGFPGGTKFGTTQPIHESGSVNDGRIIWKYLHDGAGIVRITAVADSTHATGEVVTQLPYLTGVATKFWSEGAYSDYRGWPTAKPAVREERLVLGGPLGEPDKWDATRTSGYGLDQATALAYGDFKPGLGTGRVVEDDAVRRRVGEDVARLVWFETTSSLVCATTSGEFLIAGASADDALAPASTKVRRISDYGAAPIMPATGHGTVLYVAANAETLRGLGVSPDLTLSSEDLTVLAGHIGARKFADLAWAKQPDNLLWTRLEDGGLASFTFHAEQQVRGWNTHAIGSAGEWTVESLCVVPGSGQRDSLWVTASRTKGGEPQRRVLFMSNRADKMRLDAARLYEGVAVGAVAGLTHLAGEDCLAMVGDANGNWAQYALTVSAGGVADLPGTVTGTRIVVGLAYTSRFESLPLDAAGPGTTQTAKLNYKRMLATVTGISAAGGLVGGALERQGVTRATGETAHLVEKRQTLEFALDGETSRENRLAIECSHGYDFQLHALRPAAVANA